VLSLRVSLAAVDAVDISVDVVSFLARRLTVFSCRTKLKPINTLFAGRRNCAKTLSKLVFELFLETFLKQLLYTSNGNVNLFQLKSFKHF